MILVLVIIGMFIPFLGAITINYGFNIRNIAVTFGHFLLIFGIELVVVYLYFSLSNRWAKKNMDKYRPK